MAKRKTNEEFLQEIKNKGLDIIPLELYINAKTKIKCKCSKGHEWMGNPHNINTKSYGCPICGKERSIMATRARKKDNQVFIEELKALHPNLTPLQEYVSAREKIEIQCDKGHIFSADPNHLLRKERKTEVCPICVNERVHQEQKLSNIEFLKRVKEKFNGVIIPIEEYKGLKTKIKCYCQSCKNEWEAWPSNLYKGEGCPVCNESQGEREIRNFLEKNNISFISQYKFKNCRNILPLPFDFYLDKLNILIEYDGEQHFKSITVFGGEEQFKEQQKNDEIKNKFCEQNNITLIRIPYYNFDNIENILTERILNDKCKTDEKIMPNV